MQAFKCEGLGLWLVGGVLLASEREGGSAAAQCKLASGDWGLLEGTPKHC